MVSSTRLSQITQRVGVPTQHRDIPACEPLAREIWWCEFGADGTESQHDIKNRRPVLVLGMAPRSPAYQLVPLVHVVPFTTRIKSVRYRYNTRLNNRDGQIDLASITTVPVRKLSRKIGRLPLSDYSDFRGLLAEYFTAGFSETSGSALCHGQVYRMICYSGLFKGATGSAVIVGKSTYRDDIMTHAMPLTTNSAEGNIEMSISGSTLRVDPAQLRRVSGSMFHPEAVGRLENINLSILRKIIARNLGIS